MAADEVHCCLPNLQWTVEDEDQRTTASVDQTETQCYQLAVEDGDGRHLLMEQAGVEDPTTGSRVEDWLPPTHLTAAVDVDHQLDRLEELVED